MTVGEPADKKSPGSRPMLQVLRSLEAEDRPRFKKDLLEWESQEAAHSSAKKLFLEHASSPEALFGADEIPEVPDLPPQPVPLRITISDITSQKLIRSSADRPRGLLCYLDEMNSWIRKITDKNSGEDRSCWVVSYEGEPYEMDRVGTGSIRCDNLAVSIYGNIQPTVLRQNIVGMAGDGLAQRFLPAVLRSGETKLGEPVPEFLSHSYEWEKLLRTIYSLPVQTYRLSQDAFTEFRRFQQWYEHTKREERLLQSSDVFMTSFGKIEGTTGRIILMFHLMEDPYSTVINVELVKRVICFVRTYIIPSLRYTFHEIGTNDSFDIWLANYVLQYADMKKLTLADLRNATRRTLEGKNAQDRNHIILCGMSLLEAANWVKRLDSNYDDLRGKAQWAINPNILTQFKSHREEIISIKQKRLESRYRSRVAHGYEKTEYPDPNESG